MIMMLVVRTLFSQLYVKSFTENHMMYFACAPAPFQETSHDEEPDHDDGADEVPWPIWP